MSDRRELEEIYRLMLRVPTVCILSGCFCGLALLLSDATGVDYRIVLNIPEKSGVGSRVFPKKLIITSAILLSAYFAFINIASFFQITPNVAVGLFAFLISLFLFFPVETSLHQGVSFICGYLPKIIFPASEISLTEVLVADALTSLARAISDIGLTIYMIASKFSVFHWKVDPFQRFAITVSLMCLPSIIRLRQCAKQYSAEKSSGARRYRHATNMGKYFSSILSVVFGTLNSLELHVLEDWPIGYIAFAAAIFSTVYSFVWDVQMDWGLGDAFKAHLRSEKDNAFQQLTYFEMLPYYFAIATDGFLRSTWVLTYMDICSINWDFVHKYVCTAARKGTFLLIDLTLFLEILEILRRSMWLFYRLEFEDIQQQKLFSHAHNRLDVGRDA